MKANRIIAILILIISAVILSLPLFVKTISFEHKIEPYAPIQKAYGDLVSNYNDLFIVKNAKKLDFTDRKIEVAKQNELLEISSMDKRMKIYSKIHFVDRTRKTRLEINEEIKFNNWLEHSFGVLFSQSIRDKRKLYYKQLEESIESTPDGSIVPGELK